MVSSSNFIGFLSISFFILSIVQSQTSDGLSKALSEVSLQLEKGLRKNGENLFVSPLGLVTAMGMLYLGAKNSSAQQIYQGLHFNQFAKSPAQVPQSLQETVDLYNNSDLSKNYTLNLANQVFLQQGFEILDTFRADLQTYYSAPVQQVDFANAPSKAANTINSWVSDNTEGMIKELFKPEDVNPLWRLVLTNAIYFHGSWEKAFDPSRTKVENFTKLDGSKEQTSIMSLPTATFAYKEFPQIKATVLQMNYIGQDIKMTVILPDQSDGLYEVLGSLNVELLQEVLGKLPIQKVNVKFPKFTFEAAYDEALMWTLRTNLGINDIFSETQADLSGITTKEYLFVQLVKQKGIVEVDEKGTKAAVVTAIGIGVKLAAPRPDIPKSFIVDHPFVFIISDNRNGAILFFGTYLIPVQ